MVAGFVAVPAAATRRGSKSGARVRSVCLAEKSPCVILPGLGNNATDYASLSSKLEERGHEVFVVPVRRIDWGRNARGFLMRSYWAGKLEPKSVLLWYFSLVETTLASVRETHSGSINIIGHSAGGWLGRVFLGECLPSEDLEGIKNFVTLGTPHLPPPPGALDQTRGLLTYVNECYADNFHKEISYTCVGGKALQGKTIGNGTFEEYIAYQSYRPVCGKGDTWGDGITPLESAFLEGAENITIEGARHSPLSSTDAWYGSDGYIEAWVDRLG